MKANSDLPISKEMVVKNAEKKGGGYASKLRLRITLAYLFVGIMIVGPAAYVLLTYQGPDERLVAEWFFVLSWLLYYGGIVYILVRIHFWKKALIDVPMMKKQYLNETDESRRACHEKSGGWPLDIVFLATVIAVEIAWILNSPAAGVTAAIILLLTVFVKALFYILARKGII